MSDPHQQGPARLNRNEATIWGSIAVIVAILIIGGLFYSYKGDSNTNVASNNLPAAGMNAPAPMAPAKPFTPAPAPAPTQH